MSHINPAVEFQNAIANAMHTIKLHEMAAVGVPCYQDAAKHEAEAVRFSLAWNIDIDTVVNTSKMIMRSLPCASPWPFMWRIASSHDLNNDFADIVKTELAAMCKSTED